jgi:hypothetical protein
MINFHSYIYSLIILFLLSCSCISGTIDPVRSDSQYIEYGKKFNSVIPITGEYSGVIFQASSVAIKKRYVLTAAHVVKKASNCYVVYKDKRIKIKNIICHKDFQEERFGIADIALCECDEDVILSEYPKLYSERDELGKTASICGYGISGKFDDNIKISDNTKRAGLNLIEYIQDELLVCTASRQSDKTKTTLEFIIAHGDSGGGLFIQDQLAGINSCVMATDKKTDSSYGDESCHTRISTYIPWIEENTNYEK